MPPERQALLRRKASRAVPTPNQVGKLRILGSGAMVIAPGRRDWSPLLRRGWVQAEKEDDGTRGFLPPLRITPEGLRALADALERDGHPELTGRPMQVSEPPYVTEIKAKLEAAREETREAKTEAHQAKVRLARAQRALAGDVW